ncbi:MAG: hypothetical protein GF403_06770 [Candidatus Coatesbacteria bacterium]|nr:hypothetical protein [Candidatus Coatesbacteria bacterium]
MKRIVLFSLLVVFACVASATSVVGAPRRSFGDLIYEQPYVDPEYAVGDYGSMLLADDITPPGEWTIDGIRIWGCYLSSPQDFEVRVYSDNGGMPTGGDVLQTVAVPSSDVTVTFYDLFEYEGDEYGVYQIDLELPDDIVLAGGETYWLVASLSGYGIFLQMVNRYADYNYGLPACWSADDGASWMRCSQQFDDQYSAIIELYGSGLSTIREASWGAIKALE